MNILLINHYAGSVRHGMEYRPFYISREWVRMGHRVTIVAASCSHLRTAAPAVSEESAEEEIDGVRYLWLKTPAYRGNGLGRALNMSSFVHRLFRSRRRLAESCRDGLVIASSTYPLDVFPAAAIARRAHARLAFEVHDLWPLSPMELGGMPWYHPFILAMQRAENFAYGHADKMVSLLPTAERHMREHGLAPGKFVHVPNGIDVVEWQGGAEPLPAEHREALAQARRKGRFAIVYAGSHGLANALDFIVDAARLLADQPVTFLMVGQGPEKQALQTAASRAGLSNMVFLPPVRKSVVPALLAAADALIISFKRIPIYRFGISPNKLIDYMMAGRPVIQAIEAGNDMVAESGCGISVPPEDPRAIADAVLRLLDTPPAERLRMGENGRNYVLARHDYRILARKFLDALEAA
jgi:glycosyltransferase involved in cell wall biosynthesis